MIDIIENGKIKAAIKSASAELVSLKSCLDGFEFLWQADTGGYAGHSPLLFPIVGNLPDNCYELNGKTFEMGLHGLAGLLSFNLVEKKSHCFNYKTGFNEETLKHYPYKFDLCIGYTIQDNNLKITYEVINLDSEFMLFSIGGHPFFQCPFYPGEEMSDYLLIFEKNETVRRRIKGDSLLTGTTEEFLSNSREVKLSHGLFEKGAIILEGLSSKWVEMCSPHHPKSIRVDFADFPYLGIWSFGNSPFVCIEPWHGIDSTLGDSHDFESKEGLYKLNPGESFIRTYIISIK